MELKEHCIRNKVCSIKFRQLRYNPIHHCRRLNKTSAVKCKFPSTHKHIPLWWRARTPYLFLYLLSMPTYPGWISCLIFSGCNTCWLSIFQCLLACDMEIRLFSWKSVSLSPYTCTLVALFYTSPYCYLLLLSNTSVTHSYQWTTSTNFR